VASSTVEDYLKRIYVRTPRRAGARLAMGDLAAAMGVAPGTATAMVKTLAAAGLVDYEPYAGVRVTGQGAQLALDVLRRHRLVEVFLVEVLGMDWADVHAEAERLEHAVSDRVLARMDAVLGHPRHDPHGDPIPTAKGRVARPAHRPLDEEPVGAEVRVARVLDQDPEFLRSLARRRLRPGAKVVVHAYDRGAATLTLRMGRRRVVLGEAAARKILVVPA
jgi:DtxR family Mn-dependent transcriptional regulator